MISRAPKGIGKGEGRGERGEGGANLNRVKLHVFNFNI